MINPKAVAFDIDGVCADTINLFISIAQNEYNIDSLRYEDISSYMISDYADTVDPQIIETILRRIQEGQYSLPLEPIDGAPSVLKRLEQEYGPLLFVTARSIIGPMAHWMETVLDLAPTDYEIILTGDFDNKSEYLLDRNVQYFVEDRLETCFILQEAGINPILFKQPWNRQRHPFVEVSNWQELEALIEF
jgi:5'(3')-deoxyribonucleotidase